MKHKFLATVLIILSIFSLCSCGRADEYEGYKEVYNVQSKYYFYVQPQYADSVSNLGYSNTTIVRYTTQAYAMLTVVDYFDDLSYEDIGGLSREDFSMGNSALDSTFNSRKYIQNYFNSYLSSANSYVDISQIEKITVNEHDFWLCHCYYYKSSFDPAKDDPIDSLKGEGYLYYTSYEGISYFINVNSVDSFVSETEEALDFINNFYIGTRFQSGIKFVWLLLAILLVIDMFFVLSAFFRINIEPAVIIEKIKITLRSLLGSKKYSPNEFEQALEEVKLDTILGRLDYEPTIDDDIFAKLKKSEIYLDEILGRNKEEVCENLTPYEHLDIILGRKSKYPQAIFKEKVIEPVPIVSAVEAIYNGEFNEKSDNVEFATEMNAVQRLDVILGRSTNFAEYVVSAPAELDGFAVRLQKMLQQYSENRSLRRIQNAENRHNAIVAKEEKRTLRLQEKQLRQEQKYFDKYNQIFAKLDSEYEKVGYKTFVPDLNKGAISSEETLANLDIILGRTLFSKLDSILDRTDWVRAPIYSGAESEQVVQRQNALNDLISAKQRRQEYMASRIVNVSDNPEIFYLPSLSEISDSSSVNVVNAINNNEFEHKSEEAIWNVDYNNVVANGSGLYQNYVKAEKTVQKCAHNIGVAVRKMCVTVKEFFKSLNKNNKIDTENSVEEEK